MRITRVTLEGFRVYDQLALDLTSDRTLLLGENGAGKSSIIDAIAWCLTGKCRAVENGKGARALVRDGSSAARVELTIDGFDKPIVRTLSGAGVVGGGAALNRGILDRLNTSEAAIQAVLYGGTFFDMPHADAKALLLGVLDVKVRPDQVPELRVTEPLTLADLDAAYDQAFGDRAQAKRALGAVVIPEPPKLADITLGPVGDLVKARADLAAANAAATAAVKAESTARAKIEDAKRAITRADNAAADGGAQAASALETHRSLAAEERGKLEAASQAELEADAGPTLNELGRERANLQGLLDRIEGHQPSGGCVLDASIPCLTKAKDFAGKVKDLRAQVVKLDRAESVARSAIQREADAAAARRQIEGQIAYHDRQVTTLEAKIAAAKTAVGQAAASRAELEELEAALPGLRQAAVVADAEAKRQQATVEAAAAYQASTKGRDAALETRDKLQAEVDRLEAIVARLGPKGLRTEILTAAVTDFQDAINASLEPFGFALRIQAEPWQILVGRLDEVPFKEVAAGQVANGYTFKPFALYSAGERIVIAAAFQIALAMQTGLEFVALDAAESVVGDTRAELTNLIMLAPVGQIIVAMAKAASEPAPELEGLQVVRLEHGALAAQTS